MRKSTFCSIYVRACPIRMYIVVGVIKEQNDYYSARTKTSFMALIWDAGVWASISIGL